MVGLTRYFLPDGPGHVTTPRPRPPALLVTGVRHHIKTMLSRPRLPAQEIEAVQKKQEKDLADMRKSIQSLEKGLVVAQNSSP